MMTRLVVCGLVFLSALLVSLRSAEIRSGQITLTLPEGWKQSRQAGYVGLVPPGTQSKEFAVLVIDELQAPGRNLSEIMESYWQTATSPGGGEGKASGPDLAIRAQDNLPWIWREGLRTNGVSNELPTGVAVMYRDPFIESVYVYAFNTTYWDLHKEGVIALLHSARLTSADSNSIPTSGAPPAASGANVASEPAVKPTVYLATAAGNGLASGAATRASLERRVIVVLPGGRWRSGFPPRGLNVDLAGDERQFPGLWGDWTENQGTITAHRASDTVVLTGADWARLPPVDAIRVEGSFVREDPPGNPAISSAPELVLHQNASFEDRSGLLRSIGSLENFEGESLPISAEREAFLQQPGAGKYLFNNFTLICRYSDGRIRMMPVYIPPTDNSKDPQHLVIGGHVLVKK